MSTESYQEYKSRIKEEQADMSKEDLMEHLRAEYKLDLDSLQSVEHNWVKRGIKVNCEGASHPYHGHFLTGK